MVLVMVMMMVMVMLMVLVLVMMMMMMEQTRILHSNIFVVNPSLLPTSVASHAL